MAVKDYADMPIGFMMALSMNRKAMNNFADMSEAERREIEALTSEINSRDEMHEFVKKIECGHRVATLKNSQFKS